MKDLLRIEMLNTLENLEERIEKLEEKENDRESEEDLKFSTELYTIKHLK
jgi:hypothetical protein